MTFEGHRMGRGPFDEIGEAGNAAFDVVEERLGDDVKWVIVLVGASDPDDADRTRMAVAAPKVPAESQEDAQRTLLSLLLLHAQGVAEAQGVELAGTVMQVGQG